MTNKGYGYRESRLVLCVLYTLQHTHTHRHIYISFRREREPASQAAQELDTPNVQIYQIPYSLLLRRRRTF